ncbi:hypothetical protein OVN18_08450 [Microcella daejeonensis]|uniref:Thioredoxin family protein n=1 Tax=Microcella daejeonensis TaxID=2994971 RepID=A0A9E8MK81_9MICO|nr:hypothetical protein [Microcella daejeonensis]WAB80597.1 hypothetical protein OVN18_08450 [Microcella daejeonensis]WAB85201.1 hypothetical protein OVN20_06555 [Microcella daejeonensis]
MTRDLTPVPTVEVLHIDECPGWRLAAAGVRLALSNLGRDDVPVGEVLISSADEAAVTAFAGSPTILVNGVDLFPSDGRTADLACRVYRSATGLAPSPGAEQIESALRARL